MAEEKALTIRSVTPDIWKLIQSIAPASLQSRLFGVASVEQAAMIMLKGHELGLGLAASFEFIDVIQGRPAVNPKGALALIHQSGQLAGLKIKDIQKEGKPWACEVWMKRTNGFEYTTTFTMDDAKRAQLLKPDSGWEKYPANMLRWRAVGYCADVVFPDVIGGMLRPEELGAVIDAEGHIVESTFTVVEPTTQKPKGADQEAEGPQTLADLLALGYTADAVMAATSKRLEGIAVPQTPEQVKAVYVELATVLLEAEEEESTNA